jgi:DsbE subfamily thiol:disulfide oxidoreductase
VRRFRGRLLALFVSAPLIACTVGTDVGGTVVRSVDEPLPTLSGDGVDGAAVSSQSYAGKVLVVNVWATWCGPCRQEQPDLVKLANEFAERGVAFLGINHHDDKAKAADWTRSYHVPYRSLYDPSGRLAGQLGYVGLPDTYVADGTGTIRYIVNGPTTADQLAGLIDDVLVSRRASSVGASASPPASDGSGV